MPRPEAVRREEVVVDQVVAAIRSASSLQVSVDGWPDRELGTGRYPAELTVEAVLRLSDGHRDVLWAADVMGVGWNPLLGPARSGFENRLEERLRALAEAREHGITVMYKPPVGHLDKGAAYCDAIVNYATALLDGNASDLDPLALDPDTQIQISDATMAAGKERVVLFHGLSDTVNSLDQIRATLLPPLEKKLDGQLQRAHDAGYPTILLLDRLGGDPRFGGNWLASSQVISQVVSQAITRQGHATRAHVVDLVVLVDGQSCAPIFSYWPSTPDP